MPGATRIATGRESGGMLFPSAAGLAAVAGGSIYRWWSFAAPAAAASLVLILLLAPTNPQQGDLALQLAGLIALLLGGLAGGIAYRTFTDAMSRQQKEMDALNTRLGEKHRAFLAATTDRDGSPPHDMAVITSTLATEVVVDFACTYLASADGRRFVPQPPGVGLERLRPPAIKPPHRCSGPLP